MPKLALQRALGAAAFVILVCLPATAGETAPSPASSAPATATAAVSTPSYAVYFEPDSSGQNRLAATLTGNLLGRFGAVDLRPMSGYRPGDLAELTGAVVLATEGASTPAPLMRDAAAGGRPVLWLQEGAGQLLSTQGRALGLRSAPLWEEPVEVVRYAGRALGRDQRSGVLAPPAVADPRRVQLLAEAEDAEGERRPWAVKAGSLVYVAEVPLAYVDERDRYLAFADLLYEAFAPETPIRRRAMVRIEDVGPEADPQTLRRIADVLHARGAPFSVAVYDTYVDPFGRFQDGRPTRVTLRQRPEVVTALRYMAARGGTLVMHGHTHQSDQLKNPFEGVSGGDYEFIRASVAEDGSFLTHGPLPHDDVERWTRRIDEGLQVWRDVGLPKPAAFTTPHYAATPAAYEAISRRFPVRYERALYFAVDDASDGSAREDQFFPYEVLDLRGAVILPENLGYYAHEDNAPYGGKGIDKIRAAAEASLVVRDGFASFFFHWYEDEKALEQIVTEVQGLGYRFVEPREVLAASPAHFPTAVKAVQPQRSRRPDPATVSALDRWRIINVVVAMLLLSGTAALILDPHLRRAKARQGLTARLRP